MAEALAGVLDFGYRIPQLMGFGDHWPLHPNEARNLARALDACLRTVPQKSRAKAIKLLNQWIPWISLTTTAYIITMPRINTTALSMAGRRRAGASGADQGGYAQPNPNLRGQAPADGAPNGGAAPLRTWADYRGGVGR